MIKAYRTALFRLTTDDNITGVAVGLKYKNGQWLNELCVSFRVKEKKSLDILTEKEIIPDFIEGMPTDVVEGTHKPLLQIDRLDPLQGGVSIGEEEEATAYGTLGCIVFDQERNPYVLTAYHVAIPPAHTTGVYILQPSLADNGKAVTDRIGTVSDYNIDANGDFAIIPIDIGSRGYDSTIFTSGDMVDSVKDPVIGEAVRKSGRTTGVTNGIISAIGTFSVDYSAWGLGTIYINGFEFIPASDPNEVIADDGDSGACVYVAEEKAAVGIITAASQTPTIVCASCITKAMDILDLRIIQDRMKVKMTDVEGTERTGNFINFGWTNSQKIQTVTVIFGDDYENVFLYVDSTYVDILQAKLSSDENYMVIGAYSPFPSCILGNVRKNFSISIDLKLYSTSNLAGDQNIPVMFGYGGSTGSLPATDFFWVSETS